MPIRLNAGRQELVLAYVDVKAGDLVSGVAGKAIELPSGAVIVGGDIVVKTAFNSATTATLKLGDKVDDDRYTSAAVDLKTAGRTALTLTGYKHSVSEHLQALFVETGAAATLGLARVSIHYYVDGRAAFTQG